MIRICGAVIVPCRNTNFLYLCRPSLHRQLNLTVTLRVWVGRWCQKIIRNRHLAVCTPGALRIVVILPLVGELEQVLAQVIYRRGSIVLVNCARLSEWRDFSYAGSRK